MWGGGGAYYKIGKTANQFEIGIWRGKMAYQSKFVVLPARAWESSEEVGSDHVHVDYCMMSCIIANGIPLRRIRKL